MEFQDTVKNYRSLNFGNGYLGFEGNELDLMMKQNIRLTARQIDLNKKNTTYNPSLLIILRDTNVSTKRRSYDITYKYFFDRKGVFLGGFCSGYIGKPGEYFQHKEMNHLTQLVDNGEAIKNILADRDIPKLLLEEYPIIDSLCKNTVESYQK